MGTTQSSPLPHKTCTPYVCGRTTTLLLPSWASWNKTPASWPQLLNALHSSSGTRQSSAVPAPSRGLLAAQHCCWARTKLLGSGSKPGGHTLGLCDLELLKRPVSWHRKDSAKRLSDTTHLDLAQF